LQLTTAEKRVYGAVGLFLAAFLVAAVLGFAYPALLWLGLVIPIVFVVLLVVTLWRGRRGAQSVAAGEDRR